MKQRRIWRRIRGVYTWRSREDGMGMIHLPTRNLARFKQWWRSVLANRKHLNDLWRKQLH